MRESKEVRAIIDSWWPAHDAKPRKTEESVHSFGLAMIHCQADLIRHHLALGDVADDRIPYALATLADLARRGACA